MRIQSIKFKITILYTIALGTLLVAYSSYLYLTLSKGLGEDLDIELKGKTRQIKYFIEEFNRQTFQAGENVDKNLDDVIDMTINLNKYRSKGEIFLETGNDWLKSFDYLDLSEDFIYFLNVDSQVPAFTKNVNGETERGFYLFPECRQPSPCIYKKCKWRDQDIIFKHS